MPDVLVVDIGIAQKLLNKPDQIHASWSANSKAGRAARPRRWRSLRLVEPDAESDLERLTDSFHLNLTAFGLLSFFVGLFIVNSAIGLAFEQRLPSMRTLRVCGISARLLNCVLVLELVALALMAGVVGMICGYLIASTLLPDVAASLRGLYGAPVGGELSLKPEWWIAGLAISVLGALAAAATALIKAIRMPVLAVAQPQAWQQAQHRWLILQSAAALLAFAAAVWLLWFGNSLVAGFAVLAALLLGAALILPTILETLLHFGERASQGALSVWFWADGRQQLSGLSLALMALLLALAVNVGVATMVETFSRTFLTWLDGRLAADVYLAAHDDAQASEIKTWLRGRPEVDAALQGGRAEVQIDGMPIEVLGLPDHATYRDHWPLLQAADGVWEKLAAGEDCFVSEQLSRRRTLAVGDRIDLPTPGGDWPLRIAGIYADYGNPKSQVAVAAAALFGHFPETPKTRFALRLAPAKIPALITALSDKFGLDGRNLVDQTTLKAEFDAHLQPHLYGDRGAQHLHAAGCRHSAADQPLDACQFPSAAARAALGNRRDAAAPRRIELTKTMLVAFLTALLALPLGLLVAWCLIAIVNVKAFGWRLPFHIFPLQLAKLLGVAFATSLLASLLPLLRLARMQPAELVKIFANER